MTLRNLVISSLIVILVAGFGVNAVNAQNLKIAYINSEKIKAEYKEAQSAQRKIEEVNQQWEKEAQAKQKELANLQEQLESQSLLLSEEKKREKYQELQGKAMQFEQFKAQKWGQGGEIFQKREEFWNPVQQKIMDAITVIGEKEGYDYIFDAALNVFLYIDDDQPDLTDSIIKALNDAVK